MSAKVGLFQEMMAMRTLCQYSAAEKLEMTNSITFRPDDELWDVMFAGVRSDGQILWARMYDVDSKNMERSVRLCYKMHAKYADQALIVTAVE